MSLLIKNNKWLKRNIVIALFIALCVHIAIAGGFVFTLKGEPGQYRIDMVFLGGILRTKDLLPRIFSTGVAREDRVVISDSSKLSGPLQIKVWQLGVMIDKPFAQGLDEMDSGAVLPQKFLTERVEIDEPPLDRIPGIPEAPRVPLKALQP